MHTFNNFFRQTSIRLSLSLLFFTCTVVPHVLPLHQFLFLLFYRAADLVAVCSFASAFQNNQALFCHHFFVSGDINLQKKIITIEHKTCK